jgi:hypothetical protein
MKHCVCSTMYAVILRVVDEPNLSIDICYSMRRPPALCVALPIPSDPDRKTGEQPYDSLWEVRK